MDQTLAGTWNFTHPRCIQIQYYEITVVETADTVIAYIQRQLEAKTDKRM